MSTGVVAPPQESLQEDWWDGELLFAEEAQQSQPSGSAEISKRSAFAVLEDALDLAVEAGLTDWEKRRAIDALIAQGAFLHASAEVAQAEASELIEQWETETSRLGSVQAAKRSRTYSNLLQINTEAVVRAALARLGRGPSPHVLILLQEIAGAAPAAKETTVAGAGQAWLEWGKRQGMI